MCKKIVQKEMLTTVRTSLNTLRLNHSATATFEAHCTLFLVYK